jgi:phosphoenolpyruvate synthase/pyruvate phosphate dikinase
MRRNDSIAYGAKAANLGELVSVRIPGAVVPGGFSVPFHYYDRFMRANGFDKEIERLLDDLDFVHNPRVRRQKLTELRAKIQNGKFDAKLRAEIIRKRRTELLGKGVFIRSSSNAEDLPNFSGAGLYTSVSNVKEADKIIEGVKTVWASLWNFDAYEARERSFINHRGVYMSAFIQIGVNMDNGGVLITKDPFDPENKNAVYISATWGHNLQITNPNEAVNNTSQQKPKKQVVPEQLLYTPKSNAIQILTRSTLESVVTFDERGGLKETPVSTERRVLSDRAVRDLVRIANSIKRVFGGREQDIEWGIMNGRIYILQARPFVDEKL